jgi:hypothetical protein
MEEYRAPQEQTPEESGEIVMYVVPADEKDPQHRKPTKLCKQMKRVRRWQGECAYPNSILI